MTTSQEYLQVITELIQDFRKRVFLIITILCAGTVFGYYKSNLAMKYLFDRVDIVIFISPTEGFVTKFKIAFILGLVLTIPLIIFIILNFLKRKFKKLTIKYTFFLTLISYLLFLVGASFAIFIILPLGITFLLGFATPDLQPMFSAGRYVSFATVLLLVFGVTFEMPLILSILTSSGLLTSNTLKQKRKYVILLMFVCAGFLTPPDIVSQVLLAVPLLGLYEISIFLARIKEKKRNNNLEVSTSSEEPDKEIINDLMDQMF